MIALDQAFSSSYAQARTRFLQAAARVAVPVTSYDHPLAGRDGEALALDVALVGDPQSEAMLVVSSACHGVEGFCGSGVQVASLHDDAWLEQVRAEARRSALLFLVERSTIHLGRTGNDVVELGAAAMLMTSELGLALAA